MEVPVIKEVPVEKIVEKTVEVPVEKIVEKTVEVPVDRVVEKTVKVVDEEEIRLSVKEAINEEIEASREDNYSLVIAGFAAGNENNVVREFDVPALTYGDKVIAILPYTRAKDAQAKVKALGGKLVVVTARHNADSVIKELSK